MRALAFVPLYNTPGKSDVTSVFLPAAVRFLATHGLPKAERAAAIVRFDNRTPTARRARTCLDAIWRARDLECAAFFCHGYRSGIQAGFTNKNVKLLALTIAAVSERNVNVPLYACSTAADLDADQSDETDGDAPGGDGGFADQLRDALAAAGCHGARVMGHSVKGHATINPYVRFFDANGSAPSAGGGWAVEPGSPLWLKWRRALRETSLRFTFPFMSVDEIAKQLAQ